MGSEPGVGSVKRKGSDVGVGGAAYGTWTGAAGSGVVSGVELVPVSGEHAERIKVTITLKVTVTFLLTFMESPSAELRWEEEWS
jgi:hypothetical protein